MKTIKILSLLTTLTAILFTACEKEPFVTEPPLPPPPPPSPFVNVDPALVPYFQAFVDEGRARGYDIPSDLGGISGGFVDHGDNHIAGQCSHNSHFPNEITIDIDFWNSAAQNWREMVIFHEIGHCFLNRNHREDVFDDGTCVSIMRSGNGTCSDAYHGQNRLYYIDELFNPGTALKQ